MVELQRIYVFLALFTFVYFLESIGGTYMVTAVQNIERHFRIPSKLSDDISYVLTVVLVSYYGSRGNRAKWIGIGTLFMAIAHIFTASSNFLFRSNPAKLNLTQMEGRDVKLKPPTSLLLSSPLNNNISVLTEYFNFEPIRNRISPKLRESVLLALNENKNYTNNENRKIPIRPKYAGKIQKSEGVYALDEPLIGEIIWQSELLTLANNDHDRQNATIELEKFMKQFVSNRKEFAEEDLKTIRSLAISPFAICNRLVGNFRTALLDLKCSNNNSNILPLLVIFGAMLILGFGRTMPWSLGIPLVDDNVKKQQMPIYFAMINFFKILGPICGFVIGAIVNKLYYTFPSSPPRGLSPQDPTWIGAWWLGFLFIGLVMIGPSLLLFFFPEGGNKKNVEEKKKTFGKLNSQCNGHYNNKNKNKIKSFNNNNLERKKEKKKLALFDKHIEEKKGANGGNNLSLWEFLRSYGAVLTCKVYVGASIARVLDVLAFKGYMVFLPKFLENHYGIPQYQVHIYMAFFGVLGFALGVASGGFIMKKLKLNGRKAAIYVLIISCINTGLFGIKPLLGCYSTVNSIGRDNFNKNTNLNLTRECNSDCGCKSVKLYPVCDIKGNVYYSPCHAGCRHIESIEFKLLEKYKITKLEIKNTKQKFTSANNSKLITSELKLGFINAEKNSMEFSECDCAVGGIVSKKLCPDNCIMMRYAFFITIIFGAFIAGTGVVPGMLLLLRSVPPETRSPALGLQGLLVSAIGTLPSPVLWGYVIDSACRVWDYECNRRGSCNVAGKYIEVWIIYDPWALRMRMHFLYIAIRLNLQEEDNERKNEEDRQSAEKAAAIHKTQQFKRLHILLKYNFLKIMSNNKSFQFIGPFPFGSLCGRV
ncbi:Solute carrier organic anion transporter family member [Meloidogyne graminicola]|uniref:Solute carrier organic anion transporter family member n=1 Tax=Meloidogyne graminicola TaxID=189291 RepID=A0A8S9ZIM3_9BILA|nr:Solute carrier organic anion transporter family member [Meloidogyne graminicola]